MLVTDLEASAINDGVRKFILIPDEQIHEKEIRQISDGVFAAVVGYEVGTLDHWLHDEKLIQDHGCAQPHELVDYLKRKYEEIDDAQQIWARVELVRVPEWNEFRTSDIRQALFALLFKMKTENRL